MRRTARRPHRPADVHAAARHVAVEAELQVHLQRLGRARRRPGRRGRPVQRATTPSRCSTECTVYGPAAPSTGLCCAESGPTMCQRMGRFRNQGADFGDLVRPLLVREIPRNIGNPNPVKIATSPAGKNFVTGSNSISLGFAAGGSRGVRNACRTDGQRARRQVRCSARACGHSIHTNDASRPVGASRRWLNSLLVLDCAPGVDVDGRDAQSRELPGDSGPQVQPGRAPGGRGAATRQGRLHLGGHLVGHFVVGPADRRTEQHRDVVDVCAGAAIASTVAGDDALLRADPAGVRLPPPRRRARRPLKPERNRRLPPPAPTPAWWSPMRRCRSTGSRPRPVDARPRVAVHLVHPDHPVLAESDRRAPAGCRLAATAAGSSPTWSPRLKVSNGGAETPPARVVVTRRIANGHARQYPVRTRRRQ